MPFTACSPSQKLAKGGLWYHEPIERLHLGDKAFAASPSPGLSELRFVRQYRSTHPPGLFLLCASSASGTCHLSCEVPLFTY
ncbi:hypothetical protein Cni_G05914 [Canna indica]|uniref:Uncharacterized protein n=1 Tax=Canna indica TaxID=4628 RepID=A0AAQ3JW67_9LILI|nr:hypothetical protein Cni_G05914 [Canna indica]